MPKVLVVEDEAIIRFTIADDIRDAGFEVLEARDAAEALALLKLHSDIDLLFTDIDMPGAMNGLDLSELVRATWPGVRIIVTSGKLAPVKGVLPAESRFMPKPYSSESVLQTIRQLLP